MPRENACRAKRWQKDHWGFKIIRSVWYPCAVRSAYILANLVLQDAIERIFVGDIYGDIYAGIYVIRGENVVLLGEIVPLSSLRQRLIKIGSG